MFLDIVVYKEVQARFFANARTCIPLQLGVLTRLKYAQSVTARRRAVVRFSNLFDIVLRLSTSLCPIPSNGFSVHLS